MSSEIYDAIFDHVKDLLAASDSKQLREAEQNINHLVAHKGKKFTVEIIAKKIEFPEIGIFRIRLSTYKIISYLPYTEI